MRAVHRHDAPQPPPDGELLYGRNAVIEALGGRRSLRRLFVAEGVHEDHRVQDLMAGARDRGLPIERPPRHVLDEWARGAHHQGVALAAGPYPYVSVDEIIERGRTVVALDHLTDPQNVGTLLRAAEAVAAGGVLIPADRAASITPAVVNASAGAVEHILIARVTNLPRSLDQLKRAGWWVIALDNSPEGVDLFTVDIPTPVALVIGGEGPGIGDNVRRRCDLTVSLPMRGRVASLNAATAGAIALYELLRRQPTKRIDGQ